MRRITTSAAATVSVVGVFAGVTGATVVSASATATARSQAKYCKALLDQGTGATALPTKPPTRTEAWAAEAKRFSKAAQVAPTPALKKALLRVAAYEAGLANGKKPQGATSKALAKAYKDIALSTAKCASTVVPVPGGGTASNPGV